MNHDFATQKCFSALSTSKFFYPEANLRQRFKRVKFVLRSLLYRRVLKQMYDLFKEAQLLNLPDAHRELLDKPLRPYRFAKSNARLRAEMVEQHYRLLVQQFPHLIKDLFSGNGIELGEYPGHLHRVILRYDGVFRREGELVLSIVDDQAKRLYSCAFSFAMTEERLSLAIGSVQGPEPTVEHALEKVRTITKDAYGLRPKSLVVILVLMLAETLMVEKVLAVKKRAHVFQARRYSKKQKNRILLDYDELWDEFHAVDFDSNFVLLTRPVYKPLEDIISKKRSMYRHRYEWLDSLRENLKLIFVNYVG